MMKHAKSSCMPRVSPCSTTSTTASTKLPKPTASRLARAHISASLVGAANGRAGGQPSRRLFDNVWQRQGQSGNSKTRGEDELVLLVQLARKDEMSVIEACSLCFSQIRHQGNAAAACSALVALCESGLVRDVPGLVEQLLDSFQAVPPLCPDAYALMLKTTWQLVNAGSVDTGDKLLSRLLSLAEAVSSTTAVSATEKQQGPAAPPLKNRRAEHAARPAFGPTLAVSIPDGAIMVHYWGDRSLDYRLQSQGAPVCCLAMSDEGRFLASGDEAGDICVWDLQRQLERQPQLQQSSGVASDAGMPKLVLHSRSPRLDTTSAIVSLSFCADGKRLASWSDQGELIVWSLEDGGMQRLHGVWSADEAEGQQPSAVAIHPKNSNWILSSCGSTVKLWDMESDTCRHKFDTGHSSGLRGLALSADGSMLVTTSWDNSLHLHKATHENPTNWQLHHQMKGSWHEVRNVTVGRDGTSLVICNEALDFMYWNLRTGDSWRVFDWQTDCTQALSHA